MLLWRSGILAQITVFFPQAGPNKLIFINYIQVLSKTMEMKTCIGHHEITGKSGG